MSVPKRLYCALILDESGSMTGLRDATLKGANGWMADQRKDGPDDLLTLVMFDAPDDSAADRVRVKYDGIPLRETVDLTLNDYNPNGGTPLYDAIGSTIGRIEADERAKDRNVVMVVMTDGLENASVEYSQEAIAAKIAQKEKDGWTILYLGANQDAKHVAASIALNENYAVSYAATTDGTAVAYEAASASAKAVRRNAAACEVAEELHVASATGESPQ